MLSCTLNKAISRAIFDSLYFSSPSPIAAIDPTTKLTAAQVTTALTSASAPYGLRLFPFPNVPNTTSPAPTNAVAEPTAPTNPAADGMRALFSGRIPASSNAEAHSAVGSSDEDVENLAPLPAAPAAAAAAAAAPAHAAGAAPEEGHLSDIAPVAPTDAQATGSSPLVVEATSITDLHS